jgi:hypothetical protein
MSLAGWSTSGGHGQASPEQQCRQSKVLKRMLEATKDEIRNWHRDRFYELHSLTNAMEKYPSDKLTVTDLSKKFNASTESGTSLLC